MLNVNLRWQRPAFTLDVAFRQPSRITGVFGASGAGKTTLLHLIAGLERPAEGRVAFDDEALTDTARGINVPTYRRRIGMVFQDGRLLPHYSVRGNLRYGMELHREREKIERVVEMLDLGNLLDRGVRNLSGGERQRVALGRALLCSPRMLLMDEPLASLDERLKRQILPFLRHVVAEVDVPVLYVSHDLPEILQLTDSLLILEKGRVAGCGSFRELVHQTTAFAALHDRGLANVLLARVVEHDVGDRLAVLSFAEDAAQPSRLVVPMRASPGKGSLVRVAIRPTDIALASSRVQGISIQNQIPGRVTRITNHEGRVLVEIDIGAPLLAEVSRRAVDSLAIQIGRPVWCLIKSNAIESLD